MPGLLPRRSWGQTQPHSSRTLDPAWFCSSTSSPSAVEQTADNGLNSPVPRRRPQSTRQEGTTKVLEHKGQLQSGPEQSMAPHGFLLRQEGSALASQVCGHSLQPEEQSTVRRQPALGEGSFLNMLLGESSERTQMLAGQGEQGDRSVSAVPLLFQGTPGYPRAPQGRAG